VPARDRYSETVLTWMILGLLGLILVRAVVAVLQYRSTGREQAATDGDRSDGGDKP